jgi:hypothetical protein
VADARPEPPTSLRERLAEKARAAPTATRAKWLVWALLGGTVLVVGILQMIDPSRSPVARKVRDRYLERNAQPPADGRPAPGDEAGAPPPPAPPPRAPDQGTTR